MAPALILGPLSGAFVDRVNRLRLVMVADAHLVSGMCDPNTSGRPKAGSLAAIRRQVSTYPSTRERFSFSPNS